MSKDYPPLCPILVYHFSSFFLHKLAHPRTRGWGDHVVVEGGAVAGSRTKKEGT